MRLSTHFSLAELTASTTALARGLDNSLPPELLPRLILVASLLERIRSTLGVPVTVTSGYRSQAVNAAVGGVRDSDHTKGHAADIIAPAFGSPEQIARTLAPLVDALQIGQLILEGVRGRQWVHVSTHMPERAANRVLTITDAGPVVGIQPIGPIKT